MKLTNVKGDVFDAPTSTGKALIAAGLATEVLPEPAAIPIPNTTWAVLHTPMLSNDGVNSFPCSIYATCKTCGGKSQTAGPRAHRTHFRHCRISEQPPDHIAREYEAALAEPRKQADAKIDRRNERMKQAATAPENW
jgi:hypothetical protein